MDATYLNYHSESKRKEPENARLARLKIANQVTLLVEGNGWQVWVAILVPDEKLDHFYPPIF